MNWDAIGAIAELLGALGVIATLLFLALQVRQNSKVVAANTFQAISSASSDVALRAAENPEIARLMRRAFTEPDSLDDDEVMRMELVWRGVFRNYEHYYYQHDQGCFESEIWEGYRDSMLNMLSNKFGAAWWEAHQRAYGTRFVKFINKELQTYETKGSPFIATKNEVEAAPNISLETDA